MPQTPPRPNNLKTYIINLDRSTDRWPEAAQRAEAAGLKFERVSGVDGLHLTSQDRAEFSRWRAMVFYGWPMLGGHIGCALSHIRTLQRFVQSDAPYALILEDDHAAGPSLAAVIDQVIETLNRRAASDWDVVNLGHDFTKHKSEIVTSQDGETTRGLYAAHSFPTRTTACLWSRKGAKGFLRHADVLYAPVDIMLQDFAIRRGGGYFMSPPPVPIRGLVSALEAINTEQRQTAGTSRHLSLFRKIPGHIFGEMRNLRNLAGVMRHKRAHKKRSLQD